MGENNSDNWNKERYFTEAGEENSNKYGADNPYYKSEDSFITKLSDEEKKINDKRIMDLEMKGKIGKEDIIMDDMENITTMTPEKESNYPTQEEIIAYNHMQVNKQEDSTTVTVEKSFLEKLKDFDYWKEWKNQG